METRTAKATKKVELTCMGHSISCPGCQRRHELEDHLFFGCLVCSLVLSKCFQWWGIKCAMQGECKDHFMQFKWLFRGSLESHKCTVVIGVVRCNLDYLASAK